MAKKKVFSWSQAKADIQKLLDYNADEKRCYQESNKPKNHIYRTVQRIQQWLDKADKAMVEFHDDSCKETEGQLYGILFFQSEDYVSIVHNPNGSIMTFGSLAAADKYANIMDESEEDQDNLKTRVVCLDGVGY